MYLTAFFFPDEERETDFLFDLKTTYDQSLYPFRVLPRTGLREIRFRPVTILYGGNGSGKSTVLNVIAEKLRLARESAFNRTRFYQRYVDLCSFTQEETIPAGSRIITSDDVFDMMLDIRAVNEGIERKRAELAEAYFALRREHFQVSGLADMEHLHRVNRARAQTMSRFIEEESGQTLRERSNGESALLFFQAKMETDTLCLLDEPENSLSPENQLALADFLQEAVRYCGNQLVISTHSPFLLAIPGARIIDLDNGAQVMERWTQLKNIRVYRDFFRKHADAFDDAD